MIVERLTFAIDPLHLDDWIRVDHDVWTAHLVTRVGFLGKQVWAERGTNLVHAIVLWENEADMLAMTTNDVAELDREMASWHRVATVEVFDVLRIVGS